MKSDIFSLHLPGSVAMRRQGFSSVICLRLVLFCLLFLVIFELRTASAGFLSKRKVRIKSLKFTNCGKSSDPVQIVDLQISTSEAPRSEEESNGVGGDLVVSGKVSSAVELKAPIRAEVQMQRKVLGIWVHVFCIRKFGSCDYDDICSFSPSDGYCPPLLEEHDVPCSCPILPGNYSLPDAQFRVDGTRWAGVMAGTYRGSVKFKTKGRQLACVSANFVLE